MKKYDWFFLAGWFLIIGAIFWFNVILGCLFLGFLLLGIAVLLAKDELKQPPEDK